MKNRNITVAHSAPSPIKNAPMAAIVISRLILNFPLKSALKPLGTIWYPEIIATRKNNTPERVLSWLKKLKYRAFIKMMADMTMIYMDLILLALPVE